MAKKAKKLFEAMRLSGWTPGCDIRGLRAFEVFSEACGCDTEGHPVEGAPADLRLGDTSSGYRIRDLFEQLVVDRQGEPVGASFVNEFFDPRNQRVSEAGAMAAVDYSMFAGITGQLMVTMVLKPFEQEQFVASRLVPSYQSPLEQERIIGIGLPKDPSDDITLISEQEPIKYVGFEEEYIQTPLTRKRGLGIALTKEALFFDRTGQLTDRAGRVGNLLALQKEKELLGMMIGGTTSPIYFQEKRGGDSALMTLDLFQRASASSGARQLSFSFASRKYPWINEIPDNPLNDYTALRTSDQYFGRNVDPNTGEPIVIGKPFILAPYGKRTDLHQILYPGAVWKATAGGMDTTGGLVTVSDNPATYLGMTPNQAVVSRQLSAQLQSQLENVSTTEADEIWFCGDPAEAFRWVENWPITVVQAPVNSEAEFNQDIVMRWKATMRGRAAIFNARAWQRHNFFRSGSGVDAT